MGSAPGLLHLGQVQLASANAVPGLAGRAARQSAVRCSLRDTAAGTLTAHSQRCHGVAVPAVGRAAGLACMPRTRLQVAHGQARHAGHARHALQAGHAGHALHALHHLRWVHARHAGRQHHDPWRKVGALGHALHQGHHALGPHGAEGQLHALQQHRPPHASPRQVTQGPPAAHLKMSWAIHGWCGMAGTRAQPRNRFEHAAQRVLHQARLNSTLAQGRGVPGQRWGCRCPSRAGPHVPVRWHWAPA